MQNRIYPGSATICVYIQSPSNPLEIFTILVKSFTSKDSQGMYPPLFSLNNLVDVSSTRTDPQEIYPLLFSVKPN